MRSGGRALTSPQPRRRLMRLTMRIGVYGIVALAVLAFGRSARAQCSAWTCNGASNIYTTTAHVGIGTSTPGQVMEINEGSAGRLRLSATDASNNGNGGVDYYIGNMSHGSRAAI